MGEVQLNVRLIAHTQLSKEFADNIHADNIAAPDSQIAALTAIRCCYSANKPTEIIVKEKDRYFGRQASDEEGGSEADRLIRHIMRSRHLSTLEHLNYTFAIEGLSRAALAQLTRHRHMSYSVQSQRYCRFGSYDKSGGFDYILPPTIADEGDKLQWVDDDSALGHFEEAMNYLQIAYDRLRAAGVPAEDARMVLPQAAATNLVMTANLRSLLEFYSKRKPGRGAQWEIASLAEKIREEVVNVDPWIGRLFDEV
jgi:thymidylate synthase (FAD)